MSGHLQTRQQMLDGYLHEIRLRMRRDSVAIVKTTADGSHQFIDPLDFYLTPSSAPTLAPPQAE